MWFNPQAKHVPGKQMVVTDTLSRSPRKLEQEPNTVEDDQTFVDFVESTRPATSDQLKRIWEVSAKDVQLQEEIKAKVELCQFCQQNQPSPKKKKRTTDDHGPAWQAMAEGVYRLILFELAGPKYPLVPSSDGLLFKVERDIEPCHDNKPSCHRKLKSVFARCGIPGGTNKRQWYTVQVSTGWVQIKVWIQALYIEPASSSGKWCCRKWHAA